MVVQSLLDLFSKCMCDCDKIMFSIFNKSSLSQPDLENNTLNESICVKEVKQYDDNGNWEYVDDDHRKYL